MTFYFLQVLELPNMSFLVGFCPGDRFDAARFYRGFLVLKLSRELASSQTPKDMGP